MRRPPRFSCPCLVAQVMFPFGIVIGHRLISTTSIRRLISPVMWCEAPESMMMSYLLSLPKNMSFYFLPISFSLFAGDDFCELTNWVNVFHCSGVKFGKLGVWAAGAPDASTLVLYARNSDPRPPRPLPPCVSSPLPLPPLSVPRPVGGFALLSPHHSGNQIIWKHWLASCPCFPQCEQTELFRANLTAAAWAFVIV